MLQIPILGIRKRLGDDRFRDLGCRGLAPIRHGGDHMMDIEGDGVHALCDDGGGFIRGAAGQPFSCINALAKASACPSSRGGTSTVRMSLTGELT